MRQVYVRPPPKPKDMPAPHKLNLGVACILVLGSIAPKANAATAVQITNFGANPTGIGMYLYTPNNVVAKPAILVGVHACHGKGLDVCNSGGTFAKEADKYGFLLVCPSAVSSDGCWDVHSSASLTHGGGGDAGGIVSMVNYLVANKNGDASRVFVAGHSSGGMMTNVLLGAYPDVFKAGAAFAGVPFACFAQGSIDNLGWSSTCAQGKVSMTGEQWGALVRAAYPSYAGKRPRIQFWHGTTDDTLSFHNFGEEIKEWTNVLGVNETPSSTENDAVQSGWVRTRYTDAGGVVRVEAIQETGQPHNLVVNGAEAIHFFGLDGSNPDPDAGSPSGGATGAGGVPAAGTAGASSAAGSNGTAGSGGSGGASGAGSTPNSGGAQPETGPAGMAGTGANNSAGAGITQAGGTAAAGSSSSGATSTPASRAPSDSSSCSVSPALSRRNPTHGLFVLLALFALVARRAEPRRSRPS